MYLQDDYDGKTIRMTNEAVSVLLLRPLKTEQRLKLSKTELLNVMEASQACPTVLFCTFRSGSMRLWREH